ncbi:MAG: hypothetical protein NT072_08760 [Deltaproteobacteria bacterium]|nr:hypothetical protein [Deltaproteobacteria bacterium]
MQGLSGIVQCQFWIAKNSLARLREEPRLKIIFIGAMVTFFWLGALALFYHGFNFFYNFPIVGPALIDETIYIFMAVLFFMLMLSTMVICYVSYFRSEEVAFLTSKPVATLWIFHLRFLQSVFFSSWAFLFLGMPFIISYALIKHVSFLFYLYLPLFFIVFVFLPAALSSLIVLIMTGIFSNRIIRYSGIALASAATGAYYYYRKNVVPLMDPLQDVTYFLNELLHHMRIFKHPLFPGYWMSKSLVYASVDNYADGLFYLAAFATTALLFLLINGIVAEKRYYETWLTTRAAPHRKMYPPERGAVNVVLRIFSCFPRSTAAMIGKDIKLFSRDFTQWSQFLIYFGILALYIFNLRNLPIAIDNPYWQLVITFLNLTATALAMAGFTVRFLFPLISLEGNKMWILGLAPITFRNLIFQKFVVNFIGIFMVTEILMVSTTLMLHTGLSFMIVSCGIAALASLGLVGLSLGLGSLYPSFREENPARIVSGFGGTLNFVVALCYICLLIFSFAMPYFAYYIHHSISESSFRIFRAGAWAVAIGATFCAGILPVFLGWRHLEKTEF